MTYDMLEYKTRPFNEFPEFDYNVEESQWDTWQYHANGVGEILRRRGFRGHAGHLQRHRNGRFHLSRHA